MTQRISVQEYRKLIIASTSRRNTAQTPVPAMMKKQRKYEEESLQRLCIEWADLHLSKYPDLEYMFHPANGGGRSRAEAGIMKATGVRPGVSDLLLPFSSPVVSSCRGLALELKSSTGRLSDDQRRWLSRFARDGYLSAVIRKLDDFIVCVRAWHGEASVEVDADFEITGDKT